MGLEKLTEGTEPEKKLKNYITPSVKAVAFVIQKGCSVSGDRSGPNNEETNGGGDICMDVYDNGHFPNSSFEKTF